jgi:hypothetical protein
MSDELLIALSRRGEATWPTFRRYVDELASRPGIAERAAVIPYHETVTLNVLEALGHVAADLADGAGTIQIAPRVLARLLVMGRPQAVLAGHRVADTEQKLRNACASRPGTTLQAADSADLPLAPRRLLIEADGEDLAAVAMAVEARYTPEPAAWRLLQYAGTVAEYEGALRWLPQREPNWERHDFDPNAVAFRDPAHRAGPCDGLSEFRDPQTTRNRYYLRRNDHTAEVDREWGRYTVLAAAGRSVLFYTDAGEVAVPLGALLPGPFATGLSLCSGYAPRLVRLGCPDGQAGPIRYLAYRGVPRPLAELAAEKLRQRLQPMPAFPETG